MKLIISAGDRQTPGWTHHDVRPLSGIQIVCDIMDLETKLPPESCEKIQFTHALEHFPSKEVPKVLSIIRSLLIPGGELYLEVPNFAWHAQLISEGKHEEAVYYSFGGQLDEYDFHKTGFTPELLTKRLGEAKFCQIQAVGGPSISCTCYKPYD